ncbi:hypothetical protein A4X03_0g5197 [Tilletia caries]|uniref:Integrase catalytic domain-containing protein n=1 Tax=Tilletia caries TaxID=13290 RepID=A0A8T8T8B8_9BASI|nr:hypothetical protein A4X03_0g5197 [Tilletia caries]
MIRGVDSAHGMWELMVKLNNLTTSDPRSTINRNLANLFLDEGQDMIEHLNKFMALVAEADAAGLSWGQNEREKCDRFFDTLPHGLKTVRTEWRQLDKPEQSFFALVRIYNEEDAGRKSSMQRGMDSMAMASLQKPFKIKGAASKGRGGKAGSSGGKGKSYPSSSSTQATSGSKKAKSSTGNKRVLCYGCGGRDHIRPECPVASHLGPGTVVCWECHQPGHVKTECPKQGKSFSSDRAAAAYDADEMLAAAVLALESDVLAASPSSTLVPFMVDSGASRHIVDRIDLLVNARETDKPMSFKTVGSKQTSNLVGDVTGLLASGRRMTFQDVVLLPGAGVNLLSEELLRERGWIKVVEQDDTSYLQHKDNASWRMPLTKRGRARWVMLQVEPLATSATPSALLAPAHAIKSSPLLDAHVRYGHLGFSTIRKLVKSGHLPPIPDLDDKPWCDSCEATKATRRPFNDSPLHASSPLEIILTDVGGPLVTCFGGFKYYATFIDEFTDWTRVELLRSKAEVLQRLIEFVKVAERTFGTKVQVIRTDGGGEYVNKHMSAWTASQGILHHITTPHTPELNGVAERKNRTLKEMTASMLHSSGLAVQWWGHAILFAAVLLMKLTILDDGRSVWEWVHKRNPSLGKAQAFGSPCWVHVPAANRLKSDLTVPKAWRRLMVSWPTDRSGWGVYNENTGKVVFSRNVSFGPKLSHKVSELVPPCNIVELDNSPASLDYPESDGDFSDAEDAAQPEPEADVAPDFPPRGRKRREPEEGIQLPVNAPADRVQGVRRSTRSHRGQRFSRFHDTYATFFQESEGFLCKIMVIDNDPASYGEAMSSAERNEWAKAFESELTSLINNKTLEEVVLPPGAKVVSTKWVCKTKRDADGNYLKHKARLVGRGFTQRYGIDYDETYAPVGRMTSLRIFFVEASVNNSLVWQMDAETAFLNPDMDRVLYISFPEVWKQNDSKATGLLVRKGLYGFKQSARLWWLDVVAKLEALDFTHSDADWGIFVRIELDGSRTIVFVYVDDFLIAAKTQVIIDSVRNGLKAAYKMTDIGPVSSVLGVKIQQLDHGFALSQGHYIDTVLERFGMTDCRPEPTPIAVGTKLVPEGVPLEDIQIYLAIIGCLMWIALCTRPDISFAVSALSRFNGCPTQEHYKAALRVLRHLKATRDLALVLAPVKIDGEPELMGYSDADWAGNVETRRSQSGYAFKLYGATVSWGSLRQQCVSLFSVESEYVALTEAAKDAIWLRTAVLAYDQDSPKTVSIVLNGDNQGSLALAQNPGWHRRTKHIDLRYHFIRWQVEEGALKLDYVGTSEQVADIFTKATAAHVLVKHRTSLGLTNLSAL